jgi:beta-galactosidase
MITKKLPHIFYGGDYNPEQWPEEVWLEDMKLMREAGVNLVSIAIFSWAKLESKPGVYTFGWLDRVMDLLAENGIYADLATATASPPAWMAKLHPESLPMDATGHRLGFGSRQHYCPNSKIYRQHAAALAKQLATRYKDHRALAMWHINNEYACHVPACFCDVCAIEFRKWLQARYGTLDELNARWGTAFWSQWYHEWEEIMPPRKAPTFVNPSQRLDYKRFMNHSILALCRTEVDVLRSVTPDVPVTTNFLPFPVNEPLDYFEWAKHLDFASWDSYPNPATPKESVVMSALQHDLTRSFKHGQPFVLMEQVTSQVNWRAVNVLKRPGVMRLWSYQAMAHGADGIMFFQWRASKAGAEKYHGAMVPHIGTKKSRIFSEVKQLGNELKKLDAVIDARVPAKVAIVLDWQSRWAMEMESKPKVLDNLEHLEYFYRAFHELNIAVDFVQPEGDWSQYKLVVAPVLYMLTEAAANNVRQYVRSGGMLLTTYFSGIVDENDRIQLGGYPALLRDMLGLWVEEWDPFPPGHQNSLAVEDETASVLCDMWSDVVHLEKAKALATFEKDFYAGKPAITVNKFGRGRAYYFATRPDAAYLKLFIDNLCRELKIQPPLQAPAGIEAVLRSAGKRKLLFLLNHTNDSAEIPLGKIHGKDLLTGKKVRDAITLERNGVAIIEH